MRRWRSGRTLLDHRLTAIASALSGESSGGVKPGLVKEIHLDLLAILGVFQGNGWWLDGDNSQPIRGIADRDNFQFPFHRQEGFKTFDFHKSDKSEVRESLFVLRRVRSWSHFRLRFGFRLFAYHRHNDLGRRE